MSDIETMRDMVRGLRSKARILQGDKDIFLKLSGINEEIEKASQDKAGFEKELTEAKGRRDDAKKKKAGAVSEITSKITKEMNSALPFGSAVFTYNEDDNGKRSIVIGWKTLESAVIPYNGLSGGEKQIFDAALAHVLDANIIVVEAAELDDKNLQATLSELSKLDRQVIVNTCHPVTSLEIPETFKIIEV